MGGAVLLSMVYAKLYPVFPIAPTSTLRPDGSCGRSIAGYQRPNKAPQIRTHCVRRTNKTRVLRPRRRTRPSCPRSVPVLVPRPSILVPRSSFDAPRQRTPRAACARHRRTCADGAVPRFRARAASVPCAPLRAGGTRGGGRGVCSSDGRAGSGPGDALNRRRGPPSPPPVSPARHTS